MHISLSRARPHPADVAGGKGELGFELLNLNATPATVLEPRQLDLRRRLKWLRVRLGFWAWLLGLVAGRGCWAGFLNVLPCCV